MTVLIRLWLYFRPHVFAMTFGLGLAWVAHWVGGMDGTCRVLCSWPITVSMGLMGGFLGAQLYRSEHPLTPVDPDAVDA